MLDKIYPSQVFLFPMGVLFFFFFFFSLAGCSPSSEEDFRCEGETEIRKFSFELKNIKSREELQKSLPKIKNRFNKIADLLIEVHEFQKKKGSKLQETPKSPASKELFQELARIYQIPGARELVESCQAESIRKLDKVKQGTH